MTFFAHNSVSVARLVTRIILLLVAVVAVTPLAYSLMRRQQGGVVETAAVVGTPFNDGNHVHAELFCEVDAIEPGREFYVAVRLRLAQGWHVYWENPGEAGLPTLVTFRLPGGFVVEPLGYPLPVQFLQPGDIVGYGYADEVVFVARVRAPTDLAAVASIPILADVSWLACAERCVPGSEQLQLTLPVGAAQMVRRATDVVSRGRAATPRQLGESDVPLAVDRPLPIEPQGEKVGPISLGFAFSRPVDDIAVFPGAHDGVLLEQFDVDVSPAGAALRLRARTQTGESIGNYRFEVLVVYRDMDGSRNGVVVPLW